MVFSLLDKVFETHSPTDSWLVYWLYVYQCYTYLPLCISLLASWWRLYGSLAEDSAPIVSNLITSDCIVKPYCVKSATYSKGFDYRVCPTIARGNWRFNLSNLHFAVQGNIDSTSSIVRALRSGKKENWLTQYRPRLYYSQPTRRLPCAVHLYLNYPPSPCPTLPYPSGEQGEGGSSVITAIERGG